MQIPLTMMMRDFRTEAFQKHLPTFTARIAIKLWGWIASKPKLYHVFTAVCSGGMRFFSGKNQRFRTFPFASGWTNWRDLPAPARKPFHQSWKKKQHD